MDVKNLSGYRNASGLAVSAFPHAASALSGGRSARRRTAARGAQSAYVTLGFKRAFDIFVALSALLLILPILPIIALALIIQDGMPIIYRQMRVGLGGEHFNCLKFRSMSRDASERLTHLLKTCDASRLEWETTQKLKSDPRIHTVGSILRRSSLDELPQFFNVLRGDMSVIGPRPMMVEQTWMYGDSLGAYTSVRPGITGLWQVSGRNTLNFDQRVQLDAEYAQNVTFLGDVRILVRTVWVVVAGHGSC